MSNLFDERLKRLEQEINDIKTARERLTGATTTVSKIIQVKGWAKDQDPIWGRPHSAGFTIVTIRPKDANNGFFFSINQQGLQESGWIFEYYTEASFDMTEFKAFLEFDASRDRWTPDTIKEFTTQATIVASGQFEYSVEYEEPTE